MPLVPISSPSPISLNCTMPDVQENSHSSAKATDNNGREPRRTRHPANTSEADPNPQSQSLSQSNRTRSTISSLLNFSTVPSNGTLPTSSNPPSRKKGNSFTQSTLRGLGCAAVASQQVSVPAVIRTSADWEVKRVKKKQGKSKNTASAGGDGHGGFVGNESRNGLSSGVVQEVWCLPAIGFSPNAVGPVECIVGRRNVTERGKLDDESGHREYACLPRRTVDETFPSIDSEPCPEMVPSETVYHWHVPRPSPGGIAERMMLQNSLLMKERAESGDRFTNWRLDIDHMTYEQLLDLGDRIGYVSTGLNEDEIIRCLRRVKHSMPSSTMSIERKCSICQEEWEANDEMGNLYCGHSFHFHCIKQWLCQKNACPVCKIQAIATFGSD